VDSFRSIRVLLLACFVPGALAQTPPQDWKIVDLGRPLPDVVDIKPAAINAR